MAKRKLTSAGLLESVGYPGSASGSRATARPRIADWYPCPAAGGPHPRPQVHIPSRYSKSTSPLLTPHLTYTSQLGILASQPYPESGSPTAPGPQPELRLGLHQSPRLGEFVIHPITCVLEPKPIPLWTNPLEGAGRFYTFSEQLFPDRFHFKMFLSARSKTARLLPLFEVSGPSAYLPCN